MNKWGQLAGCEGVPVGESIAEQIVVDTILERLLDQVLLDDVGVKNPVLCKIRDLFGEQATLARPRSTCGDDRRPTVPTRKSSV